MTRVRVPLVTGANGLQAKAVTYSEVPGTYQGDPAVVGLAGVLPGISLGDARFNGVSVLVDVPDDDVSNGQLDGKKIAARYPGHFLVQNGTFK